ncbi:MAG: chemotaxis protein CheA [Gammaproteobacteria bacterium]|nr:chemotaxis protein CheA [Gammaproteobacteria bacterium]
MSIDLSEFHDVFFEECFEGLDVMESGLLSFDHGTDVEEINSIFRAAHSIKGGGASFGFMDISSFTHVMETLLDEMRDGRREVTRECVDLLLESVDVLRGMIDAARDKTDCDPARVNEVKQKLEAMLAGESGSAEPVASADKPGDDAATATTSDAAGPAGWKILFRPHPDILKNGNEPGRILGELDALGELRVTADTSGIPPLQEMDPAQCYLAWKIELTGEIDRQVIDELFIWVADESHLEITPTGETAAAQTQCIDNEPDGQAAVADRQPAQAPAERQPQQSAPEAAAQQTDSPAPAPVGKTPAADAPKGNAGNKESGSIRVAIGKVDELINMVGELVITQSMLSQISGQLTGGDQKMLEKLLDGVAQLERNTRELQESVLLIRMLPISFSFSRFPRLVHDLSGKMGKKIELKMVGENTEVDKTVLEKIGDPLVHLVRNSLDHGIEMPDIRKAAGKPETGTLELCAFHDGGDIVIQVIDDGAGLNRERILQKAIEKGIIDEHEDPSDERVFNLIFAPGFSTADQVSDVSGRGVGMDVVRRNVRDLGGNVSIESNTGAGSTVTIRLPLTLAILDGQLARLGEETYIVPLVSIVESLQMQGEFISSITGESELYRLRDEYIPVIRLNDLFGMTSGTRALEDGLLMVVESEGQRVGLFVDELMGQQQVVIKSLETNFMHIQGISGATILGDGTVALIMDIPGLIQRHLDECARKDRTAAVA